ncbi:MAG TPA: histone deacetylase [Myxococcota bacterium]|nr:histone deacetylase [Myxococcota bacterium]
MKRCGIVTDPLYIKHDPGPGHPESPERLKSIYRLLEEEDIIGHCRVVAPRPASREEICRIHTGEYYQRIADSEGRQVMLDPDTSTSADSFRAAELAAGGTLALAENVAGGKIENGYALVRPPGHHAESTRAMGFCLFNNVAIGAAHAIEKLGMKRILIADWDLHNGNGTMHSFYNRADVLYFSTHQYPYYPGTGAAADVGAGEGAGFTVNVPLSPGMGDREYRAIFSKVLAPVVEQFSPDLILVSTGFDTYRRDPLGGMKMTAEGYGALTYELVQLAEAVCSGKLVLVLEGGYNLEGLSNGVAFAIRALLGEYQPEPQDEDPGLAGPFIKATQQAHSKYWKF